MRGKRGCSYNGDELKNVNKLYKVSLVMQSIKYNKILLKKLSDIVQK